jgi:hypothetical protein
LPENPKQIKSFVQLCSYNGTCIQHFSDYDAPQTIICRRNLPGNVVHTEATTVAFKTLKSRMISAPVLLIPKMKQDAEFVVATDAGKVSIARVLLQEDIS